MTKANAEILLVEGHVPTAELYTRELNREFQVTACHDAAVILELLRSGRFRAIVLEPASADGRGWHLFETITAECRARNIPIIVCSTLDERRRALQLGAVAYLLKPALPTVLRETVRNVLN